MNTSTAQRRDRLAAIVSQVGMSVPRPLQAVAPAPTAAGDGGVLINTVLGQISSADLGWTSSHEHIFATDAKSSIIKYQYPDNLPGTFPRDYVLSEGTAALKRFKSKGGGSMIDCTTVDLGRDIGIMEQVSRASGVNIIATTGCWIDVPLSWARTDPDALAALYVRDCTVGIEGTSIKAGIIKCAHQTGVTWVAGEGFSRTGEVTLRACARAAKATGLPITTHTEVAERIGLAQCALFKEEGVDMNRVYIGHNNDSTDMSYLIEILEQGVWLGLDRTTEIGAQQPDWRERAHTIVKLIQAGWGHRILVGHDTMVYSGQNGKGPEDPPPHMKPMYENTNNYCFLIETVLPYCVSEFGANQADLDKITYDNPRRFFENRQ